MGTGVNLTLNDKVMLLDFVLRDHGCFPNREEARSKQFFGKRSESLESVQQSKRPEDTEAGSTQTAFSSPGFQAWPLLQAGRGSVSPSAEWGRFWFLPHRVPVRLSR